MKVFSLLLAATGMLVVDARAQTGAVGIGTTMPASSAVLEISSNNRGVLLPRLTTAEIESIVSPEEGLLVYNKDYYQFWGYQRYDTSVAHQDAATHYNHLGTSSVGQSFSATETMLMTGVEVYLGNSSQTVTNKVRVDLYSGLGYGGYLIATDTFVLTPEIPQATPFYLPVPSSTYAVFPYSTFSIRLTCPTCSLTQHHVSLGWHLPQTGFDAYTGGGRLDNTGVPNSPPLAPSDMRFRVRAIKRGWRALLDGQSFR